MSSNSQRFASVVLAAFREAGLHTDADVAAAGGPSDSTLTLYRRAQAGEAEVPEPRSPTLRKIESAAGWAQGSARRVWEGGDPQVRPAESKLEQMLRQRLHDPDEMMERFLQLIEERVDAVEARLGAMERRIDVAFPPEGEVHIDFSPATDPDDDQPRQWAAHSEETAPRQSAARRQRRREWDELGEGSQDTGSDEPL